MFATAQLFFVWSLEGFRLDPTVLERLKPLRFHGVSTAATCPRLKPGGVDVTLPPESRSLWGVFPTLELRSCQKKIMVIVP